MIRPDAFSTMASNKSGEVKAKSALSQLDKPRSRKGVFPVTLTFHHRYMTKRLFRFSIATFVQLIARLKPSQLLDVLNGPPHLIDELESHETDFETKWYTIFKKSQKIAEV